LAVYLHITHLYRQAMQFSEMTSPIEKSFSVIEYAKTNSCTSVQRAFRKLFLMDPPPRASTQRRSDNFRNQGCICKKTSSGRDEAARQAEATSIEVQEILCGREVVSYRCRVLRMNP
jgi:hypothetical protein